MTRGGEISVAVTECEFLLMTSSSSFLLVILRVNSGGGVTLEEINNGPIIFVLGKKERSSVIWPK